MDSILFSIGYTLVVASTAGCAVWILKNKQIERRQKKFRGQPVLKVVKSYRLNAEADEKIENDNEIKAS